VAGSSVYINNGSANNPGAFGSNSIGILDIKSVSGGNLLSLESQANGLEAEFPTGGLARFYNGVRTICVNMGWAGNSERVSEGCNAANNYLDLWNSGNVILQTDSAVGGDII